MICKKEGLKPRFIL